ncbi:MAG: peptidoglycan editing factor PgeF [bacterium]
MKELALETEIRGRYIIYASPHFRQRGFLLAFTTRIWLQDSGPSFCNFGYYGKGGAELHRKELCEALGLSPRRLTTPYQTHSSGVFTVAKKDAGRGGLDPDTRIPETDSLVTNIEDTPLMVLAADCVPALFLHERTGAIGAAHAGWKGILGGIMENTVNAFRENLGADAGEIKAVLGPSIGPCCYRVGEDVASRLPESDGGALVKKNGQHFIDLRAWCGLRLSSAGMSGKNVFFANMCTSCMKHLFYSYRADKAHRGANAAMIAKLKKQPKGDAPP